MMVLATGPRSLATVVLVVVTAWVSADVGADPKPRAIPADTLPADLARRKPPVGLKLLPAADPVDQRTVQRVALGRRLFFDRILSRDRTLACASCHDPAHGFADPRPLSIGIDKALGQRNAPSLFNVAMGRLFFWDGRAGSLEDQVRFPIESPRELGSKLTQVVARLKADPGYASAFGRCPRRQRGSLARRLRADAAAGQQPDRPFPCRECRRPDRRAATGVVAVRESRSLLAMSFGSELHRRTIP